MLGISSCLTANKEGDFSELLLCRNSPRHRAWFGGVHGCHIIGLLSATALSTKMRRYGVIIKLKVIPEHGEQMLFEAHNERMHPRIEDDIGALKTHLR